MLVLPAKQRIVQPQSAASIDWTNPITRGLVFAYNAGSGLVDLVSEKTLTVAGSVVRQVDNTGSSIYTAASADVAYCTLSQSIPTTGSVSVFELSKVNNTTTTRKRSVRLAGATGTVISHDYSNGSAASDIVGVQDSASQFPDASFVSYAANTLYSAYYSHTSGNQYPVFVRNGVTASTNGNTGNGTRKEAITSVYIGNSSSGFPLTGKNYLVLVYNRTLLSAEQASLRANPWQIFQPDRRTVYFSFGAASATTVNVTDVSTTSALGTVSVLGKSLTTLSNVVATGYISSVTINGKALTNLTGVQATGVVTAVVVTGKSLVNLSGVTVSGYISSVSVISGTAAQATGVLATGSVSTPTALGKAKVNPSAVLTTSALGTVTIYEPPVPQAISGDPDFNYVSLLLPFNGSNGDITFYDASPIPKVVTRNGNTVISSTQSKFGGTSGYFDGNGDYLEISDTSELQLGTGDFTIEAWVYCTANTLYNVFAAKGASTDGLFFGTFAGTNQIRVDLNSTTGYTFSSTITLNAWTYVALVRSGTSINVYVNGVKDPYTLVGSENISAATNPLRIGRGRGSSANYLTGYIDSLRITKGLARYTSSFSVPTSPFPTDWLDASDPYYDNVVLHLPMDGPENGTIFIDRSKTPKTITTVGNTKLLATQSKFGGRSAYFDGSGDYLESPYSTTWGLAGQIFTIEAWVYITGSGYNNICGTISRLGYGDTVDAGWAFDINSQKLRFVFHRGNTGTATVCTSSGNISLNTWTHVAAVCIGNGVYSLYINGVQDGTLTNTGLVDNLKPLRIATTSDTQYTGYFNGYIDSLRITKGTARYTSNFTTPTGPFAIGKPYTVDPYASNVKLLLTGSGAHGSQVIEDKSSAGNTITLVGNTSVDRVRSKVYGGSIYFDGAGDYLTVPNSLDFTFGSGDFTVEAWVYITDFSSERTIAAQWAWGDAPNCSWIVRINTTGKIVFSYGIGSVATNLIGTTHSVSINTWAHVAVTKSGSSVKLFVNGAVDNTIGTISGALNNSTDTVKIGVVNTTDGLYFLGYINNFRITKGVARYTANFTPDYSYLIPLGVQPTLVYVEGVGIVAYIGTLNLSAIVYPIGILTDAELGIGRVAAWGLLGTTQLPNWALVNDANTSLWRLVDDSQTTDWQTIH